MKKTLIVSYLTVSAIIGLVPLISSEQTSAEMMNPNMMNNASITKNNGMTGMFQHQNITGSVKLFPLMMNSINSQINVSLGDAVITAQKEMGNTSKVIAAQLGVENGYLVYFIWTEAEVPPIFAKVIIDPGNGKVLSSFSWTIDTIPPALAVFPSPLFWKWDYQDAPALIAFLWQSMMIHNAMMGGTVSSNMTAGMRQR